MKTNMRTVLNPMIAGVLVAALAFPILAQGPPQVTGGQAQDKSTSISKVERKNRAPVSKDLLKVKIPRPFEAKLENGLTVLILEDHRFPTVSVQLNISGAGGVYDPPDIPGLASTTAQMLREGTGTRASKQIAEDIDRLGATFFASAGQQSAATGINASGLSDNLDEWFALVAEILLTPSFPADELNNFKNRQKATLRQQRAQPGFLANERFSRAVFGGHPAAVVSSNPTA
jgi:predicted Zn-dependent peptidase